MVPLPDTLERPDSGELPEGTRLLERYTILDRVGTGGMASIFRAMDDRLDRVVCVKLLRRVLEGPGSTSGSTLYRATYSHFLQEALALSKLQHPNTLRIYDFGYVDPGERPFQISEYLDAGNLDARVRRGGVLGPEEIARVLERISDAITEAHEHRIIHRDIKPSNILFARVGTTLVPKLADFGIARTELQKQRHPDDHGRKSEVDEGRSPSAVTLFSPRWAAPEQLCGGPEGPPTDVYALGLVTVYMLTGRPPFDERDVHATFNARVNSDDLLHERLQERGIQGPLLEMLMAAMSADPAERIPSAAEFYSRLQVAFAARPAVPPPMRREMNSVTIELETVSEGPQTVPPTERSVDVGRYRIRLVDVNEMLEFTHPSPLGLAVRFRVTMLPSHNGPLRINVKGLNCFVAWADRGGRPTPAIVANQDGTVDLISAQREKIGQISWALGTPTHIGRQFVVDGQELVIPYRDATHAVVLYLGEDRELIAMCKRP